MKIKIGTRGSKLALRQAEYTADLLGRDKTEIIIIKTKGDQLQRLSFEKMEGKGFFTREIEGALLEKRIDLAVHSLKDLPTENIPGLKVAAITNRENPLDMLLIRPEAFDEERKIKIKQGAVVGTSSSRRTAQLKFLDRSVKVKSLRGNVDTRIRKLREKQYDAIILACAGIARLKADLSGLEKIELPIELFVPAPGQGALGLQTRIADRAVIDAVLKLNHRQTELAVIAERKFLSCFGGGCHISLGAYATVSSKGIHITGTIVSADGSKKFRETVCAADPETAGKELALRLKEQGAGELL